MTVVHNSDVVINKSKKLSCQTDLSASDEAIKIITTPPHMGRHFPEFPHRCQFYSQFLTNCFTMRGETYIAVAYILVALAVSGAHAGRQLSRGTFKVQQQGAVAALTLQEQVPCTVDGSLTTKTWSVQLTVVDLVGPFTPDLNLDPSGANAKKSVALAEIAQIFECPSGDGAITQTHIRYVDVVELAPNEYIMNGANAAVAKFNISVDASGSDAQPVQLGVELKFVGEGDRINYRFRDVIRMPRVGTTRSAKSGPPATMIKYDLRSQAFSNVSLSGKATIGNSAWDIPGPGVIEIDGQVMADISFGLLVIDRSGSPGMVQLVQQQAADVVRNYNPFTGEGIPPSDTSKPGNGNGNGNANANGNGNSAASVPAASSSTTTASNSGGSTAPVASGNGASKTAPGQVKLL